MICSTCGCTAPIGVRSGQRIGRRVVTWYQCFRCFNAEAERNAADERRPK